jgi:hypothetical protein
LSDAALLAFLAEVASCGRTDVHARKSADGGWRPVPRPITPTDLRRHLSGEQPLGIYNLTGDETGFGAYDLDDHDGTLDPETMRATAARLIEGLRAHGIPSLPFKSGGGRGVHIWVFFAPHQKARSIRRLLTRIARDAGLRTGTRGVADGEVELYPKQDAVTRKQYGNLLALPLSLKSVPLGEDLQPVPPAFWDAPALAEISTASVPDLPDDPSDVDPSQDCGIAKQRTRPTISDRVLQALEKIDASDFDRWVRVGLILKGEFGEDGYPSWEQWSRSSAKFESAEDCRKRWDRLEPNGQIGLGSLFHMARSPATDVEREPGEEDPEWLSSLILSSGELAALDIPEREFVVEPFISASSLTMIYAVRGLGKTWFAVSLSLAVAEGAKFLAYDVPQARRVLYVDGEMSLQDLKERITSLTSAPPDALMFLPSERLFREARPLNLHERKDQAAIERAIGALSAAGQAPEMIVFDNLSSLSGGVDENDNSALDGLLRWLTGLRHGGLAIVLIHHAGKSGTQRGASRREDLLDTSIELQQPPVDEEPHPGAHFILQFAKTRGRKPRPDVLELKLEQRRELLVWSWAIKNTFSRGDEILKLVYELKPQTQKAIADVLKLSAGAISQQFQRLRERGYVETDSDGRPAITNDGCARLLAIFPELEAQMQKQGDLPLDDSPI